jgi:hypothetical protein
MLATMITFQLAYGELISSRFTTLYILLGLAIPPIIEIIVYSMYYIIEVEAFNEFENMFPAFRDGQGDSIRIKPFFMSQQLWTKHANTKIFTFNNFKSVFKFICGIIFLWDISLKTNELYILYYISIPYVYKLIFLGPILFLIYNLEYLPTYLYLFFMVDMFTGTFVPTIYHTPEPETFYSLLLWIPRILGLWYLYNKSQKNNLNTEITPPPQAHRVVRVLSARFGGDMEAQLIATLILFSRWLEITGQVERSNAMGIPHLQELVNQAD